MVSKPLAPPFEVEWVWMVALPSRTLVVAMLAIDLALAVALASVAVPTLAAVLAPLAILALVF